MHLEKQATMKWASTIVVGIAALLSSAAAQNVSTPERQPILSAPFPNPWKSLSEDETASVNQLLQTSLNLDGNQGSSQDSYV